MATEEQWAEYTEATYLGKLTANARHAQAVRTTPLEPKAILGLVIENIGYVSDPYYHQLWQPVAMRVDEFYESIAQEPPK